MVEFQDCVAQDTLYGTGGSALISVGGQRGNGNPKGQILEMIRESTSEGLLCCMALLIPFVISTGALAKRGLRP